MKSTTQKTIEIFFGMLFGSAILYYLLMGGFQWH